MQWEHTFPSLVYKNVEILRVFWRSEPHWKSVCIEVHTSLRFVTDVLALWKTLVDNKQGRWPTAAPSSVAMRRLLVSFPLWAPFSYGDNPAAHTAFPQLHQNHPNLAIVKICKRIHYLLRRVWNQILYVDSRVCVRNFRTNSSSLKRIKMHWILLCYMNANQILLLLLETDLPMKNILISFPNSEYFQ
jgi:hypothetical protein